MNQFKEVALRRRFEPAAMPVLRENTEAEQLQRFIQHAQIWRNPAQNYWGDQAPRAIILASSNNRKGHNMALFLELMTKNNPHLVSEAQEYFAEPINYLEQLKDSYYNGNGNFKGCRLLGLLHGVPVVQTSTEGEKGTHGNQAEEARNKAQYVADLVKNQNCVVIGMDGEDVFRSGITHSASELQDPPVLAAVKNEIPGQAVGKFPGTPGFEELGINPKKRSLERHELDALADWYCNVYLQGLFEACNDELQILITSMTAVCAIQDDAYGTSAESTVAIETLVTPAMLKEQLRQGNVEVTASGGGLVQYVRYDEQAGSYTRIINSDQEEAFQSWINSLQVGDARNILELMAIIGMPFQQISSVFDQIADQRRQPAQKAPHVLAS